MNTSSISRNALIPLHDSYFSISLSLNAGSLLFIVSSCFHNPDMMFVVSWFHNSLFPLSNIFIDSTIILSLLFILVLLYFSYFLYFTLFTDNISIAVLNRGATRYLHSLEDRFILVRPFLYFRSLWDNSFSVRRNSNYSEFGMIPSLSTNYSYLLIILLLSLLFISMFSSYLPIYISLVVINFISIIYFILFSSWAESVPFIVLIIFILVQFLHCLEGRLIVIISFFLFFILLALWLNDLILESNIGGLTLHELSSISFAFLLFILSEFMLFFAAFWSLFNLLLISSIFLWFSFPPFNMILIFPFGLPFTNLLILLFSSLPIQSSLLYLKTGLHLHCLEGLGQNIACGVLFLAIQFKEYLFAYFNISYSIYGSLFYFTTGLHGVHVFIGTIVILVILLLSSLSTASLYNEFHLSLQLWSNYWHFVDCLWFCVFILFYFIHIIVFLFFMELYSQLLILPIFLHYLILVTIFYFRNVFIN